MRLVAGSNPASRTKNRQQTKEQDKMGYHDRPPDYMKTGMAVVNPLIRIEKKLKEVQEVLDNISDYSILSATDLKAKIQKVLDGEAE
jgi:hypothetical protein